MACTVAFCPTLSTKYQAARARLVARAGPSDSMRNQSSASRRVSSSAAATDSFAGTFEGFTMDAAQDTFAFGNQHDYEDRQAAGDFAHASFTDSEQAEEDASKDDRRAARRQRMKAMSSWGKPGQGFPTPPSDTTSSKPNNMDI